jgi:hypothetical protein
MFPFELKYDGFRSLTVIQDGRSELISRNGNSFWSFEPLRKELKLPYQGNLSWTGEIVCLDRHGKPLFRDLLFHRGNRSVSGADSHNAFLVEKAPFKTINKSFAQGWLALSFKPLQSPQSPRDSTLPVNLPPNKGINILRSSHLLSC